MSASINRYDTDFKKFLRYLTCTHLVHEKKALASVTQT